MGGSALYILLLQGFTQFVGSNPDVFCLGSNCTVTYTFQNPPLLYYFLGLLTFVFLLPFFLSLALTKKDTQQAKLEVVAPQTIGVIGILYAIVFILGVPNLHPSNVAVATGEVDNFIFGYMGLALVYTFVRLEDRLVVALLGRAAERESIYFQEIKVPVTIDKVKERLVVPEIQSGLRLSPRIEGDSTEGYMLNTPRGFDFVTRIRLVRDETDPSQTLLKLVVYEKTRYSVHADSYIVEMIRRQAGAVLDVLNNRTPPFGAKITVPLTNSAQDSFVDTAIDDMRGLYLKSQRYSIGDKVKVVAIVGIVSLTGLLFATGLTTYGIISVAIDVLFAVNELPDVVSRSRT